MGASAAVAGGLLIGGRVGAVGEISLLEHACTTSPTIKEKPDQSILVQHGLAL